MNYFPVQESFKANSSVLSLSYKQMHHSGEGIVHKYYAEKP